MLVRALGVLLVATTASVLLVFAFRALPPLLAPHGAARFEQPGVVADGVHPPDQVDTAPPKEALDAMSEELPRIVALAAGYGHTCVALRNGRAKCWGSNSRGELGIDPKTVRDVPYEPVATGASPPPMCLGEGEGAVGFGISRHTICVALASGKVKCFGSSAAVVCGSDVARDGPCSCRDATVEPVDLGGEESAVSIVAGAAHRCVLFARGRVKCWGANAFGQLGLGDERTRGDSRSTMGNNLPFVDLGTGRTARALSAGVAFTCALLDDGSVKCWGRGDRLGLGSKSNRGVAPGQMGDALPPVDLGADGKAISIASGPVATCAVLDTGQTKCWGSACGAMASCEPDVAGDEPGEMGDALPPLALGTGVRVRRLAVGMANACALLDDDSLKCWGRNVNGELGLGDWRAHSCGGMGEALPPVDFGAGHTVRHVAVGFGYTCVVLDSDELKCWGWQGIASADAPWPDRFVPVRVPAVEVGD